MAFHQLSKGIIFGSHLAGENVIRHPFDKEVFEVLHQF